MYANIIKSIIRVSEKEAAKKQISRNHCWGTGRGYFCNSECYYEGNTVILSQIGNGSVRAPVSYLQ